MTSQRHTLLEGAGQASGGSRDSSGESSGESSPPARDPILAAAYASIMDIGLRRSTLAEIARRAGLSRMTVYRQYGDLASVVGALLSAETAALVSEVQAAVSTLPTARARAVESTVQVVAGLTHHPLLRRVLDLDPESLLPYVTDRLGTSQRAIVGVLTAEISAGIEECSVRPVDPHLAAVVLEVAAQSFVFSARVVASEAGEAEVLDELRRMADGYLRP